MVCAQKGKKTPGCEKGHPGSRRQTPPRIDRRVEHRLSRCLDCGGELRPCSSEKSQRTRLIEDIPKTIKPVVAEHTIYRDYCPCCKKLVEPKIPYLLWLLDESSRYNILRNLSDKT